MGQVVYLGLCLLGCFVFSPSVEGATVALVAAKSSCPKGVLSFRKNCYEIFSDEIPWYSAEIKCQNLEAGAHLAAISDLVEKRLLSSYLRKQIPGKDFWVGLHAVSSRRRLTWGWSNGLTYNSRSSIWGNWSPGTPSSSSMCISISPPGHSFWKQQDCSTCLPYVCKYKAFS